MADQLFKMAATIIGSRVDHKPLPFPFFLFVCIILQPLGAPTYGINVSYLGIVKGVSFQYRSPTYIYINAALVLYGS